ncbi:MAG: DUF1015 domain-containing protein [Deltaproteobacteria bacterium]|nr:DUF1015 domain-containing protein [Deltaproteobacteria bacterium]MBW2361602.1 DUF1015 domain-containing protein [Deltaproteobacteria bacterium]
MSELRPFGALRYDPARVDLGRVLVPPYDVISPEDRSRLWERDPHCAIRLELTKDVAAEAAADYADVRETLARWRDERVLRLDAKPGFYGLRTRFTAPDGAQRVREGCFGLLRLEDYEKRSVRPHERTLAGPKADRLKMMQATDANLSSVFLLYEDRDDGLAALLESGFEKSVLAEATDEAGAQHTLMRLDEPDAAQAVADYFAPRPLVIADGHHRYETALEYRNLQRRAHPDAGPDAPFEFLLVYVANAWAEGSLLLPIHRLILQAPAPDDAGWRARLPGWEMQSVRLSGPDAVPEALETHLAPLADRHAFAADDATGTLRVFARPASDEDLSVRVIHREVIDGVFGLDEAAVRGGAIAYPKSAVQTARDLRAGQGTVALYLNPLLPDDVFRVTAAGDVLPQKSTFFAPKLPTGLVFRLIGDAA